MRNFFFSCVGFVHQHFASLILFLSLFFLFFLIQANQENIKNFSQCQEENLFPSFWTALLCCEKSQDEEVSFGSDVIMKGAPLHFISFTISFFQGTFFLQLIRWSKETSSFLFWNVIFLSLFFFLCESMFVCSIMKLFNFFLSLNTESLINKENVKHVFWFHFMRNTLTSNWTLEENIEMQEPHNFFL